MIYVSHECVHNLVHSGRLILITVAVGAEVCQGSCRLNGPVGAFRRLQSPMAAEESVL